MNKILPSLILLLLLCACKSTRNWNSKQSHQRWDASFSRFTGRERLFIPKQKNKIVYLSTQSTCDNKSLSIQHGRQKLSAAPALSHHKIRLDSNLRIDIIAKEAKGSFSLAYPIYDVKKINVNFNKNLEFLCTCYLLSIYDDINSLPDSVTFEIDGKKRKAKDLYSLNLKVASEFKPFLKSADLAIIKSCFDKNFYLHYANFILSLPPFPGAAISRSDQLAENFKSPDEARSFVSALNRFYRTIGFDAFLERYRPYYSAMISEVQSNLPKENFIMEMEHFYGKSIPNYNLYPSLSMPFSSGFALGDSSMIGNVFGSFGIAAELNDTTKLHLGFENSTSLRSLSVHEFGHSFVNPAVDRAGAADIKITELLFEPIRLKMTAQGYNDWKICLYEHFVRAGEVITARLVGDPLKAQEILDDNVRNRSFIYLPQIIGELEHWYDQEYLSKTYEQKVNEIIRRLKPAGQ